MRRLGFFAVFLSALATACALGLPKVVQTVIDAIRSRASSEQLLGWLAFFIALAAISTASKFGASASFARLAGNIGTHLRLNLVRKNLEASPGEIPNTTSQSRLTVLTQDIQSVSDFLEFGLYRISGSFWLYGLGLIFIASLDPRFIPPVLVGITTSVAIALFWHAWLEMNYEKERGWLSELQASLLGWFEKWEVIKAQAREEGIEESFQGLSRNHLETQRRAHVLSAGLVPVITLVWGLVALAFMMIGAAGFRAGRLSCGQIAASFQYLVFFSMPTLDLCYAGDLARKARVAWRQIQCVLTPNPSLSQSFDSGRIFFGKRPRFFSRPLIENLLLSDPEFSPEAIEWALRKASLLNEDSDALDVWLSRNPNTFSSGERKRAAFARLFLNRDTRPWILDEPTAGLNPEIVEKLLVTLEEFAKDRAIMICSDDPRVHEWAKRNPHPFSLSLRKGEGRGEG